MADHRALSLPMPPALARRTPRVTRRQFWAATAGAAGAALALPSRARAQNPHLDSMPRPIPGAITPFGVTVHHFPLPPAGTPLSGLAEPSEIADFNGFVADTRIRGGGSGTGFPSLAFQADMGFQDGVYVAADGKQYHGTFGFI